MDFNKLIQSIETKEFKPVYFLHGEEPYFIDAITNAIIKNALNDAERDFNQAIVYGKDSDVISVISQAKEYPMMAERRLVVVREAQDLKNIEELASYMEAPNDSTIFVINYKYKKFDSRKKVFKAAKKTGVVYLSDKIKEYNLSGWINSYVKERGYNITPKASELLVEFLGDNISKIINEFNKLEILVEKGTTINEVHIEENIGISKDYNVFELVNAIAIRDVNKANIIVNYFDHNPKAGSIIMVIANIFKLHSQMMKVHFLDNKSKENVASSLKLHPFVAQKMLNSIKIYKPKKIASNIATLHEYDLKSKGVDNPSSTPGQLMKELIYKLLH